MNWPTVHWIADPEWIAGPEPRTLRSERPRDFSDALNDSRGMAKDALRCYRDDLAAERKLRLEYIEAAMEFLQEARQMVEGR